MTILDLSIFYVAGVVIAGALVQLAERREKLKWTLAGKIIAAWIWPIWVVVLAVVLIPAIGMRLARGRAGKSGKKEL